MKLSEVSSTHTPPAALSRHGTFWWLLQVAVFAVLAVVAREAVDAQPTSAPTTSSSYFFNIT